MGNDHTWTCIPMMPAIPDDLIMLTFLVVHLTQAVENCTEVISRREPGVASD